MVQGAEEGGPGGHADVDLAQTEKNILHPQGKKQSAEKIEITRHLVDNLHIREPQFSIRKWISFIIVIIYRALAFSTIRLFQVESLQRGISKEGEGTSDVEKELEEIERKMSDLERDREDRSKRIMDRRVLQVTTLQELGEF